MECTNCKIKKICRLNEMIKEFNDEIVFDITKCQYKASSNEQQVVLEDKPSISNSIQSALAESFNEEEYNRLLKKMEGQADEDINNIIIECKTCGGQDYLSELRTCSKCGAEVCGNCGTSDNGYIYCQKCWEAL